MTGSLVDAIPGMAGIAERRQEVNAARERYLKWSSAQVEKHQRAVDAWSIDVAEAIDRGDDPPPRPQPPDDRYHADAVARFVGDDAAIADERQRLLAEHAEEVEEQGQQALADLLGLARPHVAALAGIATRVQRVQADVHAVRVAVADRGVSFDPQHGGARPPAFSTPTALDVLAAVQQPQQVDLLEASPAPPIGMVHNFHDPIDPPAGLEPKPGRRPVQVVHSGMQWR